MTEQERILNGIIKAEGYTQYTEPTLAEQLREVAMRVVERENEDYLFKVHKHLITAAEQGHFTAKYQIPRKIVDENNFLEFLTEEIGKGLKIRIDENYQNPNNYLFLFDWREN